MAFAPSVRVVRSARTRREIKIVDSSLSDQQVDQIIESGQAQDVIKEALISDNLKNVVQDIEERHLAILKLEHQVRCHRRGATHMRSTQTYGRTLWPLLLLAAVWALRHAEPRLAHPAVSQAGGQMGCSKISHAGAAQRLITVVGSH